MQMKMILVLLWMSLQPWCDRSYLNLNVLKTKDIIVDFRSWSNKYLGGLMDNKMNLNSNTKKICRKGRQHLFCLRKMAKFTVDRSVMFYKSYIESILTFSMICCYGNVSVKAKAALQNCEGQWQNHRCPAKQPRWPVQQICFSKGKLHPVSQYSPPPISVSVTTFRFPFPNSLCEEQYI